MKFFGIVFLITTTLVLIFKKENSDKRETTLEDSLTLSQTYKLVWEILKIPGVRKLSVLLLTCKVCNYIFKF